MIATLVVDVADLSLVLVLPLLSPLPTYCRRPPPLSALLLPPVAATLDCYNPPLLLSRIYKTVIFRDRVSSPFTNHL